MSKILPPKQQIVNTAELQEFSCSICYEIDPEIVRCKGPCKKAFCLHCVTRTKVKNIECPNRCSKPFQVELIPGLKIQLKCPFSSELCQPIYGLEGYREHTKSCEFITKEFKQQMENREQFVCPKGHKLLFLNAQVYWEIYKDQKFFQTTLNEMCHLCEIQTICSSICKDCSNSERKCVFCNKCRPIPCSKTECPIGHPYTKKTLPTENSVVCDYCGLANSIFGDKTYRDEECNFDICEPCYQKLPQKHPLVPLIQAGPRKEGRFRLLSKWLGLRSLFRNLE